MTYHGCYGYVQVIHMQPHITPTIILNTTLISPTSHTTHIVFVSSTTHVSSIHHTHTVHNHMKCQPLCHTNTTHTPHLHDSYTLCRFNHHHHQLVYQTPCIPTLQTIIPHNQFIHTQQHSHCSLLSDYITFIHSTYMCTCIHNTTTHLWTLHTPHIWQLTHITQYVPIHIVNNVLAHIHIPNTANHYIQ